VRCNRPSTLAVRLDVRTAIALALALASTALLNIGYLREHDAAAALPAMSMRRPLHSLRLLLGDRSWLLGFGLESGGFVLYVAALALASLALVQSVEAGGIALLAYVSARVRGRPLAGRERLGAWISVAGLIALGLSLAGTGEQKSGGSTAAIVLWLGAVAGLALLVVWRGRRFFGVAAADGIAGGMLFSIGDVSAKLITEGGVRFAFLVPLVLGYTLGTALLQLGYQRGGALTVAGIATLLTNALPIAAGTVVLAEPVPGGVRGVLRVFAFVAVTAGALLLARPDPSAEARPARASPDPAARA
jgi:hypothetical protein